MSTLATPTHTNRLPFGVVNQLLAVVLALGLLEVVALVMVSASLCETFARRLHGF